MLHDIETFLAAARGDVPCDIVVRHARVVNVFTGTVSETPVGVLNGYIVGLGDYSGKSEIDAKGSFLVPGFVEGHIHVESTLLTIPEFARAVLPHGTTTAVIDPHEIANVYGMAGIRYMLDSAETCPLDIFIMLPSCVPATPLETSGATLTADDLAELINHPRVAGIGELMNFPGVYNGDPEMLKRTALAGDKVADGHAPGLSGKNLNAYILAGVMTDHESTTAREALEKLERGMHVHVREGSTEHNLAALAKIITPNNSQFMSLVSDDRHPSDLIQKGHLDYSVRIAQQNGVGCFTALQMATINTARCYKLKRFGAIAPGYHADFFLTDSLEKCIPRKVWKNAVLVAENGVCCVDTGTTPPLPGPSMNCAPIDIHSFSIAVQSEKIRVINVIEGQIFTRSSEEPVSVKDGKVVSDISRDLLKLAVIERHHATGNIGVGFVHGFGLKKGALASTVAHDSHNIIVVGTDDTDMLKAAQTLIGCGGGLVVVDDEKISALLPLPVGGLMAEGHVDDIAAKERAVFDAAHACGSTLENPFMTLSFLALTPIPELKLTDKGLVDATQFCYVELAV